MTNLMRWLLLGCAALAWAGVLPGSALAVTDTELQQGEAALRNAPTDTALRTRVAELHYLKGSDFSMRGDAPAAAAEFKNALGVLEDRQSKIPEQSPVYEEVRYGLGYAYVAMGQPQNAVVVLDQLAAGSPRFTRARYLLGVALLRTGSAADMSRGIEVLVQLAKEAPGPDGTAAAHAASRYIYDIAIGKAAAGGASAAVTDMQKLRDRLGAANGADAAENQAFLYGMGTFQRWAGNAPAAVAEYENLKRLNAGFHLANGVTIQQVLSNTEYQLGLEELGKGDEASLKQAVADFDQADANGTGKEVDTHHGKAIAYKRMNQDGNRIKELVTILELDPEYYKKINTGT